MLPCSLSHQTLSSSPTRINIWFNQPLTDFNNSLMLFKASFTTLSPSSLSFTYYFPKWVSKVNFCTIVLSKGKNLSFLWTDAREAQRSFWLRWVFTNPSLYPLPLTPWTGWTHSKCWSQHPKLNHFSLKKWYTNFCVWVEKTHNQKGKVLEIF